MRRGYRSEDKSLRFSIAISPITCSVDVRHHQLCAEYTGEHDDRIQRRVYRPPSLTFKAHDREVRFPAYE